MPKLKLKVKKMSEGKVSFISLVDRGANRIPFKIIKQEPSMGKHFAGLDLGSVFVQKKDSAPTTPTTPTTAQILGVATMDDESLSVVKKGLTDAGYSIDDSIGFDDGSLVFKQEAEVDLEKDDLSTVKLNGNAALIVKGLDVKVPEYEVAEGVNFWNGVENIGAYPGVTETVGFLRSAIQHTIAKSETNKDAAKSISALFDDTKLYLNSLLEQLPDSVKKLESLKIEKADSPDLTKADVADATVQEKSESFSTCADCNTPDECTSAKKCAGEKSDTAEAPAAKDPAKKADTVQEEDTVQKEDPLKELTAMVSGLAQSITKIEETLSAKVDEGLASVQKDVSEVKATVDGYSEVVDRVSKVEETITKTEEVVKGLTVTGAEEEDPDPKGKKVEKSERGGAFGGRDIDTAFMPGIRRRQTLGR